MYPSGEVIPEGLLRISVELAEPTHRPIIDDTELRYDDGTLAADALLKQELWSPDQRTLTLLLDPGRVKTGLIAHDRFGSPLREGAGVSLVIEGTPVHHWRVEKGACVVPDPSTWTISAPSGGSSAPLVVTFGGPIDAQSRELLLAVDEGSRVVEGLASLRDGERVWQLAPKDRWRPGGYRLLIHPRLESPCGDEIGEPFEHSSERSLGVARQPVTIPFRIAAASSPR